MICHSKRTRPSKKSVSSIRDREPTPSARRACWRTLLLVPCSLALGCSSQADADGAIPRPTRAPLAASASVFVSVPVPSVEPSTVLLGQAFAATVVDPSAGDSDQYDFGGEGLKVEAKNGRTATLSCTWTGSHTIEVTVNHATQLSAQIDCRPPLCGDSPCPGVPVNREQALECPHTNVLIRVDQDGHCPTSSTGWVGGPLIDAADPSNDPPPPSTNTAKKATTLPRLDRFCSYWWNGPAELYQAARPPLPPSGVSSDRTWDCAQVSAHTSTDELNEVLVNHGREQLGAVHWKLDKDSDTFPVRIAVVDTAAGSWRDPDNNPHGQAVGALALDTACADQSHCKIKIENYLGLPLYREAIPGPAKGAVVRRDIEHGGAFGARGDLVRAILDAVDAGPLDTPLVLNLSLAYEAALPALLPGADDFQNRVVLEALYYARCRGALILAAAGNGPVPADPEQLPGLPARWTGLPALSDQQCLNRFGVARFSGPATDPAPLLYAVSAVDFGAKPLLTTRGAGQSSIAALGFQAVRPDPSGSYTRPLTGTSMATATVSGIAASVWSHAPNLSPDLLMSRLYAFGESTGIQADFAPVGNSSKQVHRITRCSIAKAFPAMAACDSPTPDAAILAGTPPALPAGDPQPDPTWTITPAHHPWDLPWLFPQPIGDPGCGACSLVPGQLNLAFRVSFLSGSVNFLRLLAKKPAVQSIARSANAEDSTPADSTDELLEADIPDPQTDPFSVPLDPQFEGSNAAELAYQIEVDGIPFDTTESVLIQESPDADGGAAF